MGINRDAYAKMKKEVNEKVINYKNGMIMNMSTIEAAEKTPDASLDFVFIDADHSYPSCKIDMQKWLPKVKVGGYIIGHDCKVSSVKKAIEEVFGETGYETDVDQVWYVKKIMA
jgi:predicted O-methyltransferase YrrM